MKNRDYDADGQNKVEQAKLKKAFLASFPDTKEWNALKKSIKLHRHWQATGGSEHSTYFMPNPFKIPDRMPEMQNRELSKARVVDLWGNTLMLTLNNDVNPNGVGDKKEPAIARTYTISLSGRATIIPYRCRQEYTTEYFKVYCYDRTIEGVIKKFWEQYDRQATRFSPSLR